MESGRENNHTDQGKGSTIDMRRLVIKGTPDGTVYAAVPPDWLIGGGPTIFVCTDQQENMAVTMNSTTSGMQVPLDHFLLGQVFPFFKLEQPIILNREPGHKAMAEFQSLGIPSFAEYFTGEALCRGRQAVRFCYQVCVMSMYWVFNIFARGFFAIPDLFQRNFRELYTIAERIQLNGSVLQAQQQANFNNLNNISRTLSETSDILWEGIQETTRTQDRIIDKWSYHAAGEQAYYSPLENRVFVMNESLDNNVTNPHYPQEFLTSVPDHLWDKLPHERDWRYH